MCRAERRIRRRNARRKGQLAWDFHGDAGERIGTLTLTAGDIVTETACNDVMSRRVTCIEQCMGAEDSEGEKQQPNEGDGMAKKNEQIYEVQLTSLRRCRIQPSARTNKRKLATLEQDVIKAGCIIQAITVVRHHRESGIYVVVDGHRRWAVAEKLGYSRIPVRIIDNGMFPEALFLMLNGDTAGTVSGAHWCTAWALSTKKGRAEFFRQYPRRAATMKVAIQVYSEERLEELAMDDGEVELLDGTFIAGGTYDPSRARCAVRLHALLEAHASVAVPALQRVGEVLLLSKAMKLSRDWVKFFEIGPTVRRANKMATAIRKGTFLSPDSWQ